ncbi:DNA polymerase III subunit chi [Tistrella mobilis]|uniref:DNA polymerase III subunit chi n=1 Tax=Tistrella mobilis TaxID=171437 RepID=UPI0035567EEB
MSADTAGGQPPGVEIAFYHLTVTPLEQALPALLERVLAHDWRAVLRAGSAERVKALDSLLWTYDPDSFLPHGSQGDPLPERQPVWLTAGDDMPNDPQVLVLVDGMDHPDPSGFVRVLDLFDGRDDLAVSAARDRWRVRKARGFALTYWRQRPDGRWERAA